MIRHEMLAFYKALYSVCLRPYASKFPTAFIQKEFPSFVWCISCLISENNVLMHQCANKRKGYQTIHFGICFFAMNSSCWYSLPHWGGKGRGYYAQSCK